MISTPTPPLSNHIADGCAARQEPFVRITSNGTPQMTHVTLSDGRNIGLVQSATWSLEVGEYARCHVEVFASPAELQALVRDTTLSVRPAAGYSPLRYMWDWTAAWLYNAFTRP